MVAMFFESVAKRLEARGAPPSGVGRLADIGEGVGYIKEQQGCDVGEWLFVD